MRCSRCYDTKFATAACELTIDDMIPLSIDLRPTLNPRTLLDPLYSTRHPQSQLGVPLSGAPFLWRVCALESGQATHCEARPHALTIYGSRRIFGGDTRTLQPQGQAILAVSTSQHENVCTVIVLANCIVP